MKTKILYSFTFFRQLFKEPKLAQVVQKLALSTVIELKNGSSFVIVDCKVFMRNMKKKSNR